MESIKTNVNKKSDIKMLNINIKSYEENLLSKKDIIKQEELIAKNNEADSFNELNKAINNSYIQNTEKTRKNNDFDELNHDTWSEYRQDKSKSKKENLYDELDYDNQTIAAVRTSAWTKWAKQAWQNLKDFFS